MRNISILSFLLAVVVLISSCSKFSKLQKEGTVEQKYEAALVYYKKADYYRAGLLFEEITPLLKGAKEAELSQFYNAYCNYHQGLYNMSQFLFKNFYDTFQRSEYAPEAFYMHAYSLYRDSPIFELDQTSTLTAISALQDFINTYPESPFREECTKLILELRDKLERKAYEKAKLYYKTSEANIANYRSAVVAINNFERDFPNSKYTEELAYTRIVSEYNLAKLSFQDKQKERFEETNKFYLTFIDKFPQSKYVKQAERFYENTQKELGIIAAADKVAKEAKAAQTTPNTGKLTTPSSGNN
ncbi:MAG: outer membrane protein assembly factor BamD [Runella slithyformis]|jgi:outer membrane protein assembly factor BamD|nr:MAG: outer membrane protein assembly factor BamD [Runella sp.]TAG15508.1 MAG: outer membrane protein assembly factor BamD [Cytophagales bacterium]TAG42150.1 MAG: outer membrane protein assembly factor BamD [Cytophagia bacterium]TAG76851.1 MAG: outer membrane protein assembly factor BamD [Cytophagales bacterium]TAH10921.1 MAG: outer membrane protein assembly factor BamD [Runella slithyformis]